MELGKRISLIVKHSRLSVPKYAQAIGSHTPQAIRDLINGKTKSLSDDMSRKILSYMPELNASWLFTGEGEMLQRNETYNEDHSDQIDESYLVPLIPISVMAGRLSDFDSDGVDLTRCERIISPIKGVEMAFPVYGDSMEPEYPAGSHVFVKRINYMDFIPFGNVFVLDTTNGPLLKKVQRSDIDGCIRCVSLNVDAGYEPFDVPMRTVRGMYRVLMCLSLKG